MGTKIECYVHLCVFTGDKNLSIKGGMIVESAKIIHELPATQIRVVAILFALMFHNNDSLKRVATPGRVSRLEPKQVFEKRG